jgi:indoleamine 2,3-dioxygenase
MALFSYMASLYVYTPAQPIATKLPRNLSIAWHTVAQHLDRPPILSYASQVLHNWQRIHLQRPISVGNLTLTQNFLGGQDEEWFVTIHVNIEAVAGKALAVLVPAQTAVSQHNISALILHLQTIVQTLTEMHDILRRMPERCDPYVYYHRVRPFMFGWQDNPALPQGMVYDGVYDNQPQRFRGETGAQSSIIPALDAALGIQHEFDAMRAYLAEMRDDYMPRQHREFIELLENGRSLREFVAQNKLTEPALRTAYNDCLATLQRFRQLHIQYAALYILKPAQGEKQGDVGTGGTPFTIYLKKHIRETADHKI